MHDHDHSGHDHGDVSPSPEDPLPNRKLKVGGARRASWRGVPGSHPHLIPELPAPAPCVLWCNLPPLPASCTVRCFFCTGTFISTANRRPSSSPPLLPRPPQGVFDPTAERKLLQVRLLGSVSTFPRLWPALQHTPPATFQQPLPSPLRSGRRPKPLKCACSLSFHHARCSSWMTPPTTPPSPLRRTPSTSPSLAATWTPPRATRPTSSDVSAQV
jgi:hypothetical protein